MNPFSGLSPDQIVELKAFGALRGMSDDWRRDLVTYLRSDIPITELMRNQIADAIEGTDEDAPKFELPNIRTNKDAFTGAQLRADWFKLGHEIQALIDCGRTRQDAVGTTAAKYDFSPSDKQCDKCLIYYRRAVEWTSSLPPLHPYKQVLDEYSLLYLFHRADADKKPLDRPGAMEELEQQDFLLDG